MGLFGYWFGIFTKLSEKVNQVTRHKVTYPFLIPKVPQTLKNIVTVVILENISMTEAH